MRLVVQNGAELKSGRFCRTLPEVSHALCRSCPPGSPWVLSADAF